MPLIIGPEQRVNVTTAGLQSYPSIAGLTTDGWVVTWTSKDADGDGIFLRRYDKFGGAIGGETLVNTATADDQNFSSVTALAGGGWVVTWQSEAGDGSSDVYQRVYGADGSSLPASVSKVNTTSTGNQNSAHVAALTNGGWVVTWMSLGQDEAGGYGIYQQRYSSTGTKVGGETQVNTATANDQSNSSVTGLADGGWVVTWESSDGSQDGVYQQRYKSDGTKLGLETRVNASTTSDQDLASVTALSDGGWVVTWESLHEGSGDVYQQRYSGAGAKVGGETKVNVFTPNGQDLPEVAGTADGGWVVAWVSFGQDEAVGTGIYQRRYTVTPPPVSLTGTAAKELAPTGAVVGELPVAEPGDSYTYALLDSAGGRFVLSGNQLLVNKGILLDYEQRKTHTVTLMVTDAAGLSTTQKISIKVANVSTEKTAGTSAADTVVGGSGRDTFSGGGGGDRLTGGGSTDTLRGGSGHDRLDGGTGKDTLTGNSGQDAFLFTTKPGASNVDTLRDFQLNDAIWLENAIFKGIGSGSLANPKKMLADAFHLGAAAQDAEDRILYDQATGSVFYDRDGIGAAAAVKFAVVATKKALTLSDFYVI